MLSNLGRIFLINLGLTVGMLVAPRPAYADPMVGPIIALWTLGGFIAFIIVVSIEVIIIANITGLSAGMAFAASLVINIISTVIGLVVFRFAVLYDPVLILAAACVIGLILLVVYGILSRGYSLVVMGGIPLIIGLTGCLVEYFQNIPDVPEAGGDVHIILTFIICFGLSLAVEIWPARYFVEADAVESGVIYANVGSYCALGIVMMVLYLMSA